MKTRFHLTLAASVLASATLARPAGAVCADTAAQTSEADNDIAAVQACTAGPHGQDQRNVNTSYVEQSFALDSSEWQDRGWNTPCNSTTELEKLVNAGLLFLHGVQFNQDPNQLLFGQSYHSAEQDYFFLGSGDELSGDWHDHFRYQAVDNLSTIPNFVTFAQYLPQHGFNAQDLVQLTCFEFDKGKSPFDTVRVRAADAQERASTLVHEAWHGWENEHDGQSIGTSCGHTQCGSQPTKGSCVHKNECDVFTPHALSGPGAMVGEQHRPIQAAVEFLCDIADTPQDWVPLTVRELASADADVMGTSNFVNGPMPACFAFGFGQHFATCPKSANQCDQALPCAAGSFCNPQSGCCQAIPNTCTVPGGQTCDGSCPCDAPTNCCIILK
jgi:hypothetical protein